MLSLWVVRHGETDWNLETRVQGWTDIPLNSSGEAQAERLGFALQGIPFQCIIASDLMRATRTAQIISQYVGRDVKVDSRLRERHFGMAEGMIRTESEALYPNDAPDAEPLERMDRRAADFLAWTTDFITQGRLLCVTHGGFVRAILRSTFDRDTGSPPNTSVTRLRWDEQEWTLVEFGSTAHL